MSKQILLMFFILVAITACADNESQSYTSLQVEQIYAPTLQNIQVSQGQILPPYGMKIVAQMAALKLRVSTSQKESTSRLEDIEKAIEHISALASESGLVTLEDISVNQASDNYERESSTANVQNLDMSSITLKLATNLSKDDHDLMASVVVFSDFLNTINLPDTITIETLSVGTELGDLEPYRQQLIAQVYQELDLVQEEYGPSAKFEVTGLYDQLKTIALNDTEYYIYLEPIIIVKEF